MFSVIRQDQLSSLSRAACPPLPIGLDAASASRDALAPPTLCCNHSTESKTSWINLYPSDVNRIFGLEFGFECRRGRSNQNTVRLRSASFALREEGLQFELEFGSFSLAGQCGTRRASGKRWQPPPDPFNLFSLRLATQRHLRRMSIWVSFAT